VAAVLLCVKRETLFDIILLHITHHPTLILKIEDWLINWHANNKMASSTNQDDAISTTQLTQQVEHLSINDNDVPTIICANCGKEGTNLNICNKCKAATYCNAACKKKHRHKHKDACGKRVTKLREEELERERRAAELHDEKLFKQPPPNEDCPICMLPLPTLETGISYNSCCGKTMCSGCIHAVAVRDIDEQKCPFCRTPAPTTNKEAMGRLEKRIEAGDAVAIYGLGCCYANGSRGLPQNRAKALELWHQATELGNAIAYYGIGVAYDIGNGVERDEKKARHNWELAAIGGDIIARHNLGGLEANAGNVDRALKHLMIAAGDGLKESLSEIQEMFKDGDATKEDYTQALQAYQAYLGDIKSPQRDEAAAFSEKYKYYEV
jgi:TPR repeat protein